MNRKAKCNVYLRDLQEQAGLTDEALQLIARVCGPRWDYDNFLVLPFCQYQLACQLISLFASGIDKLKVTSVSCAHLHLASLTRRCALLAV